MSRDEALAILRAHADELRSTFGVASLSLFGSVARDEARPGSDIDVLVEFSGPPTFDGYFELLEFLEGLFRTRVDLITVGGLKPRARSYIERDLIRVA